ncbi:hypothetical protein BLNAU_4957 [Blattamonas nauphoetae]|uniref:Right handed beta helix domain-containing protein n=1 Tax=Blattamonas nauphoetae TaxID=2049346 RepID=A0ABQ9Y8Q9_9EUKA|nr:hypothetical protein BLNAU_4957 [Blattamonas nauphoetae]
MIALFHAFALVTCIVSCGASIPPDNATLFNIELEIENEQTEMNPSKIALLAPLYHTEEYVIDSREIALWGDKTTILHSSCVRTPQNSPPKAKTAFCTRGNMMSSIIILCNSSILLSDLAFDCGTDGICVSKISSSTLTLTTCRIVSNCETSPFVLFGRSGRDGTSISLVNTTHRSSCPHTLLPLGMFSELAQTPSDRSDCSWRDPVHSIRSVSLCLSDCALLGGTGPLVDFSSVGSGGRDVGKASMGVSTWLVAGELRNVSWCGWRDVKACSLFSQGIVGTSVADSADHLAGTTSLDLNSGGDLLCMNSSFAGCSSSLSPSDGPTYSLQHRSSSDIRYFISSSDSSAIIFKRCTFHSMKESSKGSAIYVLYAPSSLLISECSFAHIISSYGGGGAVTFDHETAKYPFTLTSSSFLNCSTNNLGGSVYVLRATTATISSSFFKNSTVTRTDAEGGGICFDTSTNVLLSNSVFLNCSAGTIRFGGGGLSFADILLLKMDSIQFRECRGYQGNDILSDYWSVSELASNVTNCDSTSGSPSWYIVSGKRSDDSLVPQTTTARTLQSIVPSLGADGISATLRATVSDDVEGTMLVLVDNTDSEDKRTANSAPAIQRLLSFAFASSSTTSSLTVRCGDWEILQLGQTYSVIGSSINGTNLSSNSLTLVMPHPPQLNAVVCRSGTGLDHAWLRLVGRGVVAGTYVVHIEGMDDFACTVSFDGSTEDGTQNMYSTEVSISLFGEGSKFSPNTQYEVNLVKMEGSSEGVILDPSRLFFTTPDPPRLTSVGGVQFTDASKSSIEVDLFGVGLAAGDYTLVVSSASGAHITLEVEWSDSSSGKVTAIVYSLAESAVDLSFGETYTISSLSNTEGIGVVFNTLTFMTPTEPARLVSTSSKVNAGRNGTTMTLTSRSLSTGSEYSISVVGTPTVPSGSNEEHSTTLTMMATSAVSNTFSVSLYPFPGDLLYGHTYSVDEMNRMNDSSTVLIEKLDCVFSTPTEPERLVSVSCASSFSDPQQSKLLLIFSSRALLANSEYTLTLQSTAVSSIPSHTKRISVTTENDGTIASFDHCLFPIEEGPKRGEQLEFGVRYTVVSFTRGSTSLLFDTESHSFVVPAEPPQIESASIRFNVLATTCIVTFAGTRFRIGKTYQVTLNTTHSFTITMESTILAQSEELPVGSAGSLQFETKYEVSTITPLDAAEGDILFDTPLTLSVPTKPTVTLIFVDSEKGSEKTEECGTIGTPCNSVLVGWRVGEENDVDGVVVKIDGWGGFGGRVVVGEKKLEIVGVVKGKSRLVVEDGVLGEGGEEGAITMSGGSVVIEGVTLCLPPSRQFGKSGMGSVMRGFGECVVESVSIVSGWKLERVGMGLVCWLGGSLTLRGIVMEGVEMESDVILVNCSSSQKDVSFEMDSCRLIGVVTRNTALDLFSSKSEESHIGIGDCVFVSTERVESGGVVDGMGVIVVSTWQEKTLISKCVFSDCGTVEGTVGSLKKGGVVVVRIGSGQVGRRKEILLHENVFVDSSVSWSGSVESGVGGVVVWSDGVCQVLVDVFGSWFEETRVSGVVLDRDSFGVPIIERKRKIVHTLSGSGHAGLVVVVGRVLPVIRRKGSSFSGCSLRIVRTLTTLPRLLPTWHFPQFRRKLPSTPHPSPIATIFTASHPSKISLPPKTLSLYSSTTLNRIQQSPFSNENTLSQSQLLLGTSNTTVIQIPRSSSQHLSSPAEPLMQTIEPTPHLIFVHSSSHVPPTILNVSRICLREFEKAGKSLFSIHTEPSQAMITMCPSVDPSTNVCLPIVTDVASLIHLDQSSR